MTHSEFQALRDMLAGLRLQFDDMSAKVAELNMGHALIAQRLDSEKLAALREAELIKQLAEMDASVRHR